MGVNRDAEARGCKVNSSSYTFCQIHLVLCTTIPDFAQTEHSLVVVPHSFVVFLLHVVH